MGTEAAASGTQEYRVVLIQPESHGALALAAGGSFRLPRVSIPAMSRPARQLQKAIKATWGISAFMLDTCVATHGVSPCVVAEVHSPQLSSDLEEVALDRIVSSELSNEEHHECQLLLQSGSRNPLARIGWIDEVLGWVASITGRGFSTKNEIEQLNAGRGFALLRFRSDDGGGYWLKATSAPNTHELSTTSCLSGLCPEFLPKLIAMKKEWNAWLMEDAGEPLCDSPGELEIAGAVRSFATLQVRTVDAVDDLLATGAFDQRLPLLRRHLDEVIAFLIDAMARQTSTKVAPLRSNRVKELGMIVRDALCQLEVLGIPDALVHNDLNRGNILHHDMHFAFIDWSEAAVGVPFFSLERFRLLNRDAEGELRRVYGEVWREYVSQANVNRACQLAPLLSIFAYLYGRGDWLKDAGRVSPQFESYARSLARHMDRAAQDRSLQEVLCR